MIAERLELWRLSNFTLQRMSSAEDIYLFHAVARENPKDERLIAIAEIRDLTAARDSGGRAIGFPQLEGVLAQALADIRHALSRRPPEAAAADQPDHPLRAPDLGHRTRDLAWRGPQAGPDGRGPWH